MELVASDRRFISYSFIGKNIGYGAGHNIAIKMAIKAKTQYHIVMNPDLAFNPKIIDELIEYMNNNKDIAMIMPKVLNAAGDLQYLCKLLPSPANLIARRFFPRFVFLESLNDRYVSKHIDYTRILNPPCLSGCFMFLRVDFLVDYDLLFDERFFMYCEDVDFVRRLHRVGKTVYYPHVSIVHNHARESYGLNKMFIEHIKSAIKYFNKYGWIFDWERRDMNLRYLKEIKDCFDGTRRKESGIWTGTG
jgi:GT2 family glycosyltransferase